MESVSTLLKSLLNCFKLPKNCFELPSAVQDVNCSFKLFQGLKLLDAFDNCFQQFLCSFSLQTNHLRSVLIECYSEGWKFCEKRNRVDAFCHSNALQCWRQGHSLWRRICQMEGPKSIQSRIVVWVTRLLNSDTQTCDNHTCDPNRQTQRMIEEHVLAPTGALYVITQIQVVRMTIIAIQSDCCETFALD